MIHCNKNIFLFFACLYFLLIITGRNKAIIVEFKKLFVLNGTFITSPVLGVFSQLLKKMPALAFNFMIAATNA